VNIGRAARQQLVDPRALARHESQESADPLDVFAFPHAPRHDDGDVGIGDVEAFVQHLRRHERSQLPFAEACDRIRPFPRSDVAGQRHDQVLDVPPVPGFDAPPLPAGLPPSGEQALPSNTSVAIRAL